MNLKKLVEEVRERKPDRVLVQVPEGLKTRLQEIEGALGEEGIEVIGSVDPCYGACDLKDSEARDMDCDLLVHLGHSKFLEDERVETLYFPVYYDVDPVPIVEENSGKLDGYGSVGLISSVNFLPAMDGVREKLDDMGVDVLIGKGEKTKRGQILGCDTTSALKIKEGVDCFLYVGSGEFHPAGVAMETDKPVFSLDFEGEKIEEVDTDRFERQRHVAVEKARDSERFGILVSTKGGQMNVEGALDTKKRLEETGKKGWIFSMDEVSPEKLEGMDVDCLVNTACPRIAVEHRTDFDVPVVNVAEMEEIL